MKDFVRVEITRIFSGEHVWNFYMIRQGTMTGDGHLVSHPDWGTTDSERGIIGIKLWQVLTWTVPDKQGCMVI